MRKYYLGLLCSFLLSSGVHAQQAEVLGINFYQENEISKLEVVLNSNNVEANRFHVPEDKQIILDLQNVNATERVMRAFDTSEFSGSAVFVSAYRKPGDPRDIRIAIQLRDNVRSVIKRMPNRIVLEIENRFGAFARDVQTNQEVVMAATDAAAAETSENVLIPRSESVEDILENLTLSGRKRYVGRRITLNVRNVNVEDILKMIAEASGFNIITTSEIGSLPPLSLNLTNIPWDQALDTVLGLNKLVAEKNGMILLVRSLAQATRDIEDSIRARQLAQSEEPLVTKVFPISYSDIEELKEILEDYLTEERGKISVDLRTNSLIVKDTVEVMERMRRIVETLDTQTPQVLIEGKIVEVTENYAKRIGLGNGVQFGYDPIGLKTSGTQPSPIGSGTSTGGNAGPGFSFNTAPALTGGAGTVFGLSVARFNRMVNLNFALQLLETESKAKIIASPRVITQNKKRARIASTDTIAVPVTLGAGDNAQTSFDDATASLALDVTPQVTNEGSINLEIELQKEQFGARPEDGAPPDKQSREITTNVLVDNGSTIVLGGIYNYEFSESHSGVPFLKDVPLIGWLFRSPHNPETRKNELVIFITPRVINQEEAGIAGRG
jgi:type IV pilus assembly protein PilQ